MNYLYPELLDQLAREYVLGTLRGPARRRFEGLLGASVVARRCVLDWERRLVPLALELAPTPPPARAWERLAAELGFNAKRPAAPTSVPLPYPPSNRRWAAIAAGLAAVALAIGLFDINRPGQVRIEVREPAYVVVIADKVGKALWSLTTYPELREIRVHAVAATPISPAAAYELWMLPDAGTAPVSLGLLPAAGDSTLALDERRMALLATTSTLAVSREPPGGSPTGAPTGPVLYTAPVVRLGT